MKDCSEEEERKAVTGVEEDTEKSSHSELMEKSSRTSMISSVLGAS